MAPVNSIFPVVFILITFISNVLILVSLESFSIKSSKSGDLTVDTPSNKKSVIYIIGKLLEL